MKVFYTQLLLIIMTIMILINCGCTKATTSDSTQPSTTTSMIVHVDENNTINTDPTVSLEDKEAFASSTPENDTDMGLKNIKIDSAEQSLTDQQKSVIAYFDDDYLNAPSYEFLRRYPMVFDGAQLKIWGTVKKVISMTADEYEIVFWFGVGPVEYTYADEYPEYDGCYIYLTGKTDTAWFMEGDTLEVYGRYVGVQSVDIDGTSYTIPQVDVQKAYFDTSPAPKDIYRHIEKFSIDDVKKVAEIIFGTDIEVRLPIPGTDIAPDIYELQMSASQGKPLNYIVELENQSNAKFTKYFFATGTNADVVGGRISDAKDALNPSGIERYIEFSADFSHFFLFTYDRNLENLTLEYYDNSLNKVWKREFAETTNAIYDYTKNNIYLVTNNELFIINIETGEDTFVPSYVGEKAEIRKLNDGILMISSNKSDGVMKVSLNGSIIWKVNLAEDTYSVDGVQIINDKIVIDQYYWNSYNDYGTHYIVLDNSTGSIIVDAISIG